MKKKISADNSVYLQTPKYPTLFNFMQLHYKISIIKQLLWLHTKFCRARKRERERRERIPRGKMRKTKNFKGRKMSKELMNKKVGYTF